jgi:hypothetical protein
MDKVCTATSKRSAMLHLSSIPNGAGATHTHMKLQLARKSSSPVVRRLDWPAVTAPSPFHHMLDLSLGIGHLQKSRYI